MSKFYARMQQRRGTAAEWTAANPILQAGEIGYETDTEQFKIGNGTDTWSALEYWEGALPDQTSNSGKFLTTDGTDAAWADVDTFPSQSGNSGYFLTTDGTAVAWAEVDALPTQTGNTGYYLKTDGTTASWDELSIDDLVAVSLDDIDGVTITGTPGEGQSLIYDSSTSQWINVESGGSVSVSATAPAGPDNGDMWWNSEDAVLYVYYVDVDADGYWVEATAGPLLNQALADLSDTNITSPTIDQTLVYNGTQWVNQDSNTAGNVIQVVSVTKTDTYSVSIGAGAFDTQNVPTLDVSITPTSTASKILVSGTISIFGDTRPNYKLMRDGSDVTGAIGDADGSRARLTSGQYAGQNEQAGAASFEYLDSPSTTSAVTYGVRMHNGEATTKTIYVNRGVGGTDNSQIGRYISTITLMEVAG